MAGDARRPNSTAAGAIGARARLYRSYVSTSPGHIKAPPGAVAQADWFYAANLLPHLPQDRSTPVLDVGCGHGALVSYLLRLGYRDVRRVDLAAEQVALARRLGLQTVWEADGADYLRQHRGEFGVVTAFDVLEHLTRDELLDLLDAVHAGLRQGGRFIAHTVNGASPFAGRLRYGDLTHETAFTATSLHQALRLCGFSRISVHEPSIPVHGWKSAIRRLGWPVLRLGLLASLLLETGVARGHVLTQTLVAVADR